MNNSFATFTILLALIVVCSANLKPTSLTLEEALVLQPSQTIRFIVKEQQELYQKVLKDFLNSLIKSQPSSESANRIIFQKITSDNAWEQLRSFMIETLFVKFEMNTLSDSFGSEIKQFPDNYFLTFEMYDLLHD